MPEPDPIFKLRLPSYLREKLEAEASEMHRTLTAEILNRLEMSFSDVGERINRLEEAALFGVTANNILEARIKKLEALLEGNSVSQQKTTKPTSSQP